MLFQYLTCQSWAATFTGINATIRESKVTRSSQRGSETILETALLPPFLLTASFLTRAQDFSSISANILDEGGAAGHNKSFQRTVTRCSISFQGL